MSGITRHIKAQTDAGHRVLVGADSAGSAVEYLGLEVLRLDSGGTFAAMTTTREAVAVILTGTASFEVGSERWTGLGGRADVFESAATAVYIPIRTAYSITAESPVEIALLFASTDDAHPPFVVEPDEVDVNARGEATWQRTVRDIVTGNADGRVGSIIVGETIAEAGNWSSYPPHKHDGEFAPEEGDHEEIYLFRVQPEDGFGVQLHYTADRGIDDAHIVRDGDAFVIEKGYHPVAAAGGHRLYYLWVMAGPSGRDLAPYIDPVFRRLG